MTCSSPATFLLTRNAALDLRRIHTRSLREWSEDVADQYLADLYAVDGRCCRQPGKGPLAAVPFGSVSDGSGAAALRDLRPGAAGIAVLTVQTSGPRHRILDSGPDLCLSRRSRATEEKSLIARAHARRSVHKLGRPVSTWSPEHVTISSQAFGRCMSHGRDVRGDTLWCCVWLGQTSMS
jgi:toxin ParE1/3/4